MIDCNKVFQTFESPNEWSAILASHSATLQFMSIFSGCVWDSAAFSWRSFLLGRAYARLPLNGFISRLAMDLRLSSFSSQQPSEGEEVCI